MGIVRATVVVAFLVMSALWFFKQAYVSRLFLLLLLISLPAMTLDGRAILLAFAYAFSALRRRGHNTQYMLIVGTSAFAEAFADSLKSRPGLGLDVIGHLSTPDDPGRRATSLDELPQLWNVLRGEMSLVGPRPPLVAEVASYDIWHRRRLSMKPGITGLWQVEARERPGFDDWVERDLAYIDRWSILLDFKILLRTIPAVIQRTGT